MKKIGLICVGVLFFIAASARQQMMTLPAGTGYEYCEVVGTPKAVSTQLSVSIEPESALPGTAAQHGKTVRPKPDSPAEAINLLAAEGWELVAVYKINHNDYDICRWLMRRKIKSPNSDL